MKILVTGATGKLGTRVVETLLKTVPASQLAVSVRNPEKAEGLRARGVDVRLGDFDRPETLTTAFAGIDRLLIISADGDTETRIRQHTNAVAAAEHTGVKLIAYTSLANASDSTIFLAPVHRTTEEIIVKTGIPYTFYATTGTWRMNCQASRRDRRSSLGNLCRLWQSGLGVATRIRRGSSGCISWGWSRE